MAVSNTSDEIWKGISQFRPRNIGAIDTNRFRSVKAMSH